MKRLLPLTVGAACISAVCVSSPARAFTIDFETDAFGNELVAGQNSGKNVGNAWADYGVTISARDKKNPNKTHKNPLWLYNTNCKGNTCTGGDSDLATGADYGTDPMGNVLIIQENANKAPDDDAGGGIISFQFDAPTYLNHIGLLDLDDNKNVSLTAYLEDGSTVVKNLFADIKKKVYADGVLKSTVEGNNSLWEFVFNQEAVTRLDVNFPSSGAVAYLKFNEKEAPVYEEVPEPTSAIALVALSALGVSLRRRK